MISVNVLPGTRVEIKKRISKTNKLPSNKISLLHSSSQKASVKICDKNQTQTSFFFLLEETERFFLFILKLCLGFYLIACDFI